MSATWTGPAVVDMTLTELGQATGRVTPELVSGGIIRLRNGKTRQVIGYIVPPSFMPDSFAGAEELMGSPPPPKTRHGRYHYDGVRGAATVGDFATLPAAAAARVLGVPERTLQGWRAAGLRVTRVTVREDSS